MQELAWIEDNGSIAVVTYNGNEIGSADYEIKKERRT